MYTLSQPGTSHRWIFRLLSETLSPPSMSMSISMGSPSEPAEPLGEDGDDAPEPASGASPTPPPNTLWTQGSRVVSDWA